MDCPYCGKGTEVTDSRPTKGFIRRRRRCLNEHRFTTTELVGEPGRFIALINAIERWKE